MTINDTRLAQIIRQPGSASPEESLTMAAECKLSRTLAAAAQEHWWLSGECGGNVGIGCDLCDALAAYNAVMSTEG